MFQRFSKTPIGDQRKMRNCNTSEVLNVEEPSSPSQTDNLKINKEHITEENSSVSTKDNSEAVKNEIQNKKEGCINTGSISE